MEEENEQHNHINIDDCEKLSQSKNPLQEVSPKEEVTINNGSTNEKQIFLVTSDRFENVLNAEFR